MDAEARFHGPDRSVARGPQQAAELLRGLLRGARRHELHRTIMENGSAAVVGTLIDDNATRRDFVDVFAISDHGLLLSWRRFHTVGHQ